MFTVSRTLPVNDDPTQPKLTRSQMWQGLVMKAENPVPFVESMTACTVVERTKDGLVRDFVSRGEPMRERITFHPQHKVVFERLKSSAMGTILNEIVENEKGELCLKFTFTLEVAGMAHGSPEEKAYAETIGKSYQMAVNTTIAQLRELARQGSLAAE